MSGLCVSNVKLPKLISAVRSEYADPCILMFIASPLPRSIGLTAEWLERAFWLTGVSNELIIKTGLNLTAFHRRNFD
jgi:hypothetical protein